MILTMLLAALCFVWAGMVLGISFLETPVKFTAPSVTLAIGLDVGRHVFRAFNKVEIGLTVLVIGMMSLGRPGRAVWVPLSIVTLILALQMMWLRPVLDARVGLILNGEMPPSTPHHLFYIGLEVLKLLCLLTAGIACLWALKPAAPGL